jgi:hypothetical protein
MSWFASSLSLKPRLSSPRQGDAAGDNDDEGAEERDVISEHAAAAAAGKGVREDLSELTKSLTRQLWGVASFLAPPPPAEKSNISPPKAVVVQVPQTDEGIPLKIGEEKENDAESESSDAKEHLAHFAISGISARDEGTGISDSPKPSSSPNSAGQRLIGFRSDLAELRGTVATSFSRIQSVIRSVTADEDETGGALETFTEGSEDGDQQSPAGHGPRNSGFNSLFGPLFDGMLARESPAQTEITDRSSLPLTHTAHDAQAKEFEQHTMVKSSMQDSCCLVFLMCPACHDLDFRCKDLCVMLVRRFRVWLDLWCTCICCQVVNGNSEDWEVSRYGMSN